MFSLLLMQEKMRAQQSKFLASIDSTVDDGSREGDLDNEQDSEESDTKQVVCSLCHDHNSELPISFLILLQVHIAVIPAIGSIKHRL